MGVCCLTFISFDGGRDAIRLVSLWYICDGGREAMGYWHMEAAKVSSIDWFRVGVCMNGQVTWGVTGVRKVTMGTTGVRKVTTGITDPMATWPRYHNLGAWLLMVGFCDASQPYSATQG